MAENIGIISALWRFVSFYKLRKALGIARAADRQFTGSTQGISDAFTIHRDKLVQEYKDLESGVAQYEQVIEGRRIELEELDKRESILIQQRDGALAKAEEAQTKNNQEDLTKHKAAFMRFQDELNQIEARKEEIKSEVSVGEEQMKTYLLQLTKMQDDIRKLSAQKAQAIADFVSSQKIMDLNNRLRGLTSTGEAGPIDAVLKANQELKAQARISSKLAGTDVAVQDNEYAAAGRSSTADTQFEQMMAARKASREAVTGAAKPEEREKI